MLDLFFWSFFEVFRKDWFLEFWFSFFVIFYLGVLSLCSVDMFLWDRVDILLL